MIPKDPTSAKNFVEPKIYSFSTLTYRDVSVRADDYEIRIISGKETPTYFTAGLCGPDLDRIRFGVRTVNERGARDPFFRRYRASDLAASAIAHFEQVQPIAQLAFNWCIPTARSRSDNYMTYIGKRDELQEELGYEEAQSTAAFATWTLQKIALPNGFTTIERLDECGDPAKPVRVQGVMGRGVEGLEEISAFGLLRQEK